VVAVPYISPILGTPLIEHRLRETLSRTIKSSGVGRAEIARRMTEALGRPITVAMLADFIRSPFKKRGLRFPAAWIPSFCDATGSRDLKLLPLTEEERVALEMGEWLVRHLKTEARKVMESESRQKAGPRKAQKSRQRR
jgi:hypothetical protein